MATAPVQRLPGALPPQLMARWRELLAPLPAGSLKLADVLDLQQVLAPLRSIVSAHFGDALQLVASQCWVRRGRPPHVWHQDGALNHDFIAQPDGAPLLTMATCWIALDDCGVAAPGLEWINAEPGRMLPVAELDDAALRRRYGAAAFVHPALAAGEALLFGGSLLHRTHVTPAMQQPRTSVELRFIAAGPVPRRLAGETLLPLR